MSRATESGYSIIEVMIFLAITGLLFASAVVGIGGSQRQAEYSQAVRDFETQIKDVMNDISNGYYPEYTGVGCTVTANTIRFVTLTSNSTNGPGTNQECMNIGKSLMFNLNGNTDSFGVSTIVGINPGVGSSVDLSLDSLAPTMAYNESDPTFDLTVNKPIRYGARVTKIASVAQPEKTYSSLGFLTGFSVAENSSLENGTLTTNILGIPGSLREGNPTVLDYRSEILSLGTTTSNAEENLSTGYFICLTTKDERRARVIIGVDGVLTATKSEFDIEPGGVCP